LQKLEIKSCIEKLWPIGKNSSSKIGANQMETQEEMKIRFDQKVKEFDKYFEYADDARAYNKGKAQLIVLRSLGRQLNIDPDQFEKLTGYKL
jgi:hypothetical protein